MKPTSQQDAAEWGQVLANMYQPALRKDARWSSAIKVWGLMPGLLPRTFVRPVEWTGSEGNKNMTLVSNLLGSGGDIAEIRERAQAFPVAFGEWRLAASNNEADNSAKLQVLVGAMATAASLAGDPDYDGAAGMEMSLYEHIRDQWNIKTPPSGDVREWCVRQTRDYARLPRAWRYV
jgi:hypothetical protein